MVNIKCPSCKEKFELEEDGLIELGRHQLKEDILRLLDNGNNY